MVWSQLNPHERGPFTKCLSCHDWIGLQIGLLPAFQRTAVPDRVGRSHTLSGNSEASAKWPSIYWTVSSMIRDISRFSSLVTLVSHVTTGSRRGCPGGSRGPSHQVGHQRRGVRDWLRAPLVSLIKHARIAWQDCLVRHADCIDENSGHPGCLILRQHPRGSLRLLTSRDRWNR